MSLLRRSIAGRLLRANAPAVQRFVPSTVRWESQTAVGTPLTIADKAQPESSLVEQKSSKDTPIRYNQPDYTAEVDQASSYVNGTRSGNKRKSKTNETTALSHQFLNAL